MFRTRGFVFRKTVVCRGMVYTTVFLKMNPRVRNMQKTPKLKNENINLEKVHYVGLYCIILIKHNLLDIFSKNIQIPNLMEIPAVGVDLFHADGQT